MKSKKHNPKNKEDKSLSPEMQARFDRNLERLAEIEERRKRSIVLWD